MATIRVNGQAFAAGARFAPAQAPAAPTVDRRFPTNLPTGTIVEFRRARQPQVVHQAVVFYNSEGKSATGANNRRAFASLNDDLTTIWRQGVDTIPGTYKVLGRMAAVEVNPA